MSQNDEEEQTMTQNYGKVVTLQEYKTSTFAFCQGLVSRIKETAKEKNIKLNDGQRLLMSRFIMLMENDEVFKNSYRWRLFESAPKFILHILLTLENPCWIPEFMDPEVAEMEEQHECDPAEIIRLSKIIPHCTHEDLLNI